MSSKQASPCLWVKPEPFEIGIIPCPLPAKLTHYNLRKLFAYAKNKGKSGYPRLSYSIWKHVACNKLQIEESLAWIYFHTCEILTECTQEKHMQNVEAFIGIDDTKVVDEIKDKRHVDLLKFILYLFIQRAHVISMKSPLVTGDEFPIRVRSNDLEGRAAIGTKGIDENSQMSFMMTNMTDILDLLVEPDTYGVDNSDVQLSPEAVNKLSFLIGTTFDGRKLFPLDQAAHLQHEFQKAGFSKISQMFSARRLQSWIKAYLGKNPFGIGSCLSIGQRLRGRGYSCGDDSFNSSLNMSTTDDERLPTVRNSMEWCDVQEQLARDTNLSVNVKSSQANLVNRIISNANYAIPSCKRVICNQVCRRTVARSGDVLSHSAVKVHRCQNSHLYLLAPLRSVFVEKCHDTTVVLGSVDTVVVAAACENVKIITPCKRILIISCRDSSFHLCTSSPPVLIGKNQNIKLAPYYTCYPGLVVDMTSCGIPPQPNFWNTPTLLGNLNRKQEDSSFIWMEFPPAEFFKFVIPFEFEGKSKVTLPVHLPQKYKDALLGRERRIEEWHQMIRDSVLRRDQRIQLQSMVNEKFQEWLRESGNNTLLESLAPPVPPAIPRP